MTKEEEVRALLRAMRDKMASATPETQYSCDDAVTHISGRVAALAAECSLPELDWWKRATALNYEADRRA